MRPDLSARLIKGTFQPKRSDQSVPRPRGDVMYHHVLREVSGVKVPVSTRLGPPEVTHHGGQGPHSTGEDSAVNLMGAFQAPVRVEDLQLPADSG